MFSASVDTKKLRIYSQIYDPKVYSISMIITMLLIIKLKDTAQTASPAPHEP